MLFYLEVALNIIIVASAEAAACFRNYLQMCLKKLAALKQAARLELIYNYLMFLMHKS